MQIRLPTISKYGKVEIELAKSSYFSEQIETIKITQNLGYSHKQKDSASVVLKVGCERSFEAKSIADHVNILWFSLLLHKTSKRHKKNW